MGEVMNTLKVMPENPDVDLEQLKAAIADLVKEPASYTLSKRNLLLLV